METPENKQAKNLRGQIEKPELRSYAGAEAPKILIDPETGIEQIEFEKDGETSEVFLRTPEGKMLYYANITEISRLEADERLLELGGVEVSPSIRELIDKDGTKYYIKFSELL